MLPNVLSGGGPLLPASVRGVRPVKDTLKSLAALFLIRCNEPLPHVLLLLQEQLPLLLNALVLLLIVLVVRGLLQAHSQVFRCRHYLLELVLH